MSKQDIEIGFPALVGKDYEISDEDFNYNCLAYGIGCGNETEPIWRISETHTSQDPQGEINKFDIPN
jgi:hypothetical protein